MNDQSGDLERLPSRRTLLGGFATAAALAALPANAGDKSYLIAPRPLGPEIDRVVKAIESRLDGLAPDRTLFVPIGENHGMPSHTVFLKGLVTELKRRGHAIAVGIEAPYNNIIDEASPYRRRARGFLQSLFNCDRHGQVTLHYNLSRYNNLGAAAANRVLRESLLAQDISTRFNDLPGLTSSSMYLSRKEPLLQKVSALREHRGRISVLDTAGMYLRNIAMVSNAGGHAIDAGARIYIQNTGAAHVYGERKWARYDQSLAVLWENKGDAVLPVILCSPSDINLPAAARSRVAAREAIQFYDLPNRSFDYEGLSDRAFSRQLRREVSYLKQMGEERAGQGIPRPDLHHTRAFNRLTAYTDRCRETSTLSARLFGPAP